MKDNCSDEWDATFIDRIGMDRPQLFKLCNAASFMDIKSLVHLACAKIATMIKGTAALAQMMRPFADRWYGCTGQPLSAIQDILGPLNPTAPPPPASDAERKEQVHTPQ